MQRGNVNSIAPAEDVLNRQQQQIRVRRIEQFQEAVARAVVELFVRETVRFTKQGDLQGRLPVGLGGVCPTIRPTFPCRACSSSRPSTPDTVPDP